MDNDMLPNDGAYFMPTEPVEQTRKRDSAKAATKAAEQFILEELKRLDERIAFYNTFNSIPTDVLGDPELLGFHIAANKQTAANLNLEKDYLKGVLKNI
jgi:hypothetical protein